MLKALVVGIALVLVGVYQFTGITPVQVILGLVQMAQLFLAGL